MTQPPLLELPHPYPALEAIYVHLDLFPQLWPPEARKDKSWLEAASSELTELLSPVKYHPALVTALITDVGYRGRQLAQLREQMYQWRQRYWNKREILRYRARVVASQIREQFSYDGSISLRLQLALQVWPQLLWQVCSHFKKVQRTRCWSDFRRQYLDHYYTPHCLAYQNLNRCLKLAAGATDRAGEENLDLVVLTLQLGANDVDAALAKAVYRNHLLSFQLVVEQHGADQFVPAVVAAARAGHRSLVARICQIQDGMVIPGFHFKAKMAAIRGGQLQVLIDLEIASDVEVPHTEGLVQAARYGQAKIFSHFLDRIKYQPLREPQRTFDHVFEMALAVGCQPIIEQVWPIYAKIMAAAGPHSSHQLMPSFRFDRLDTAAAGGHHHLVRRVLDKAREFRLHHHNVAAMAQQATLGCVRGGYFEMAKYFFQMAGRDAISCVEQAAIIAAYQGYRDLFTFFYPMTPPQADIFQDACRGGNLKIVQIILARSRPPPAIISLGVAAAATRGYWPVVQLLLSSKLTNPVEVLCFGVENGQLNLLQRLLRLIQITVSKRESPTGSYSQVAAAPAQSVSRISCTIAADRWRHAARTAARRNYVETLEVARTHGRVDISAAILLGAAEGGHLDLVRSALASCSQAVLSDIWQGTYQRSVLNTALLAACQCQHQAVTQLLIAAGADAVVAAGYEAGRGKLARYLRTLR